MAVSSQEVRKLRNRICKIALAGLIGAGIGGYNADLNGYYTAIREAKTSPQTAKYKKDYEIALSTAREEVQPK